MNYNIHSLWLIIVLLSNKTNFPEKSSKFLSIIFMNKKILLFVGNWTQSVFFPKRALTHLATKKKNQNWKIFRIFRKLFKFSLVFSFFVLLLYLWLIQFNYFNFSVLQSLKCLEIITAEKKDLNFIHFVTNSLTNE